MYNCPTRWYRVVDEMSVDKMSVDEVSFDELSWNQYSDSRLSSISNSTVVRRPFTF